MRRLDVDIVRPAMRFRQFLTSELDEDITSLDTHNTHPQDARQGPMTRARARQLNYQVSSFLGVHNFPIENRFLSKSCDFILLRNQGKGSGTATTASPGQPYFNSRPIRSQHDNTNLKRS